MNSQRITLFLGAGFSAAFGHPTMNQFLTHANASDRIDAADKKLLAELVLEARRANSFLESSPTNLEDILSFYIMGERLGLEDSSKKHKVLTKIIQKIYTNPGEVEKYWGRYSSIDRIFGKKIGDIRNSLTFITTNYDLNIESALYYHNLTTNPGFEFTRATFGNTVSVGNSYSDIGVPLYKLHGSVNWFSGRDNDEIVVDDRQARLIYPTGASLPFACTANYANDSPPPILVPPSFLKPDFGKTIKRCWSGAANSLKMSDIVIFLGYSFPSSDTEMLYFLARALSDNATIHSIYIVDTNANEIVARLKADNSRFGSHFKSLLKSMPVNSTWLSMGVVPI